MEVLCVNWRVPTRHYLTRRSRYHNIPTHSKTPHPTITHHNKSHPHTDTHREIMITWFFELFGFKEFGVENGEFSRDHFIETRNQFMISQTDEGDPLITSRANYRSFRVGVFSTPTLNELRQQFSSVSSNISRDRKRTAYQHIAVDDIIKIHSRRPGSTFQVASQFNCLEFGSPSITPEHGVSGYSLDPTQGPSCALACAAGTVYRNYFACTSSDVSADPEDFQINNLDILEQRLGNDREKYWSVRNGYSNATEESLTRLNKLLAEKIEANEWNDIMGCIKIGTQRKTQVTFSGRFEEVDDEVLVNQVYCSALSCGYSDVDNQYWENFARLVLEANYEAALLFAAIVEAEERQSTPHRVYLTFLGGGVFQNEPEWIAAAIGRAIAIVAHANANLEVFLCHHKKINHSMRKMMDETFQREYDRLCGVSHSGSVAAV